VHAPEDSHENDATLELEITDLSRGGAGVARQADGRVIFVPLTAPGDRVRARIVDTESRFANAELLEVLRPSPERIQPRCPLFGRCGGCQWQHLPYSRQWATKLEGVRHALRRTGVPQPDQVDERPADRIWEYRNRVQLRGHGTDLGFFAARSNSLVPADRCDIARPEINTAWDEIRREAAPLPSDRIFKVEVEVLADGSLRKTWNSAHAAAGFRQVHDEQNEALRDWVGERIPSDREVLDLFGGSGNLSLSLAARVRRVDCVDTGAPRARPEGTPTNVEFHRAPVLGWLLRRAATVRGRSRGPNTESFERFPTAAILDPPRDGLGRDATEIISALEALRVREAVAVGCDPDSWARDLSRFLRRGWRLERVAVIDLFPQTPHVESVAYLTAPFDSAGQGF
jgi:23S rRNA (uracil1939-C5)-methyltransferase